MNQKQKILQVAWSLFRENGLKATTIEGICKELKISKKTFYKYFRNKEDLINFSFEINKQKINQMVEHTLRDKESPFIVFVKILKYLRSMLSAKTFDFQDEMFFPISPIIVEEISTVYPNVWENIDQFRHNIIKKLSIILENEKEDYLREDINTKVVTTMLLATIENIVHPEFIKRTKVPIDEAIDSVITLLFTGMIKTEKQSEIKQLIYESVTDKYSKAPYH